MIDYNLGKIYGIKCLNTDKIYIGSTTRHLEVRLIEHIYRANTRSDISSYQIIKNGNFKIFLMEEYPCKTKKDLLLREQFYIKSTENCINKIIPLRTSNEYYKDNQQRIIDRQKNYDRNHKEQKKDYYIKNKQKKHLYYINNKDKYKKNINKSIIENILNQ